MFHDLDSTLAELLKRELSTGLIEPVTISFATPDGEFPPSAVQLPAINLFLHDIQENRDLRSTEPLLERQEDGRVLRIPAPVRVDCHYLVTAWAKGAPQPEQDEHRLLGQVMRVLLRHREIPRAVLQGSMQDQALPLRAAVMASQQQTRGEFWQALGGKPKAAFNYTVTISIDAEAAEDIGAPAITTRI